MDDPDHPRNRRSCLVDLRPQMSDVHDGHIPGDGYGPDVDPVTGDEAETEEPEPEE